MNHDLRSRLASAVRGSVRSQIESIHHARRRPVLDDSGTILVYVTIVMLVFVGFLGMVIDLGYGSVKRERAQTAADAAALGAMMQVSTGSTEAAATTTANLLSLDNGYPSSTLIMGYLDSGGSPTANAGSVVTVTASVSQTYPTLFLRVIGLKTATVGAQASAVNVGGSGFKANCVVCILGGPIDPALSLNNTAQLNVPGYGVIDNGNLSVNTSNTFIHAQTIGVGGSSSIINGATTSPAPTTITQISDPLAAVPTPPPGGSANSTVTVTNQSTRTISAGVYTYIEVNNGSTLTMNPGTYYITNDLWIYGQSTLKANNVLLYFTCGGPTTAAACNGAGNGQAGGYLTLDSSSYTISAPTSGTYKGLTVFYDRNNRSPITLTNQASGSLSGTIYAKRGTMMINNSVAAPATRLVAGGLSLDSGSHLTFNFTASTNYAGNPIPALSK